MPSSPPSPSEPGSLLGTSTWPSTNRTTRAVSRLFFLRMLARLAIAVTSAMMIDEFSPSAPFCGTDGDCQAVTHTAYGRPLGVPLSLIGWTAFVVFFAVSLNSRAVARNIVGTLALAAGITGITLLCLQRVVLQQMCPMCVIVDSLAVSIAALEFFWPLYSIHQTGSDVPIHSVWQPASGLHRFELRRLLQRATCAHGTRESASAGRRTG